MHKAVLFCAPLPHDTAFEIGGGRYSTIPQSMSDAR